MIKKKLDFSQHATLLTHLWGQDNPIQKKKTMKANSLANWIMKGETKQKPIKK